MESALLLRYHEIALKGGNRKWFEKQLAQNAKKLLKRELGADTPIEITFQRGRILLHFPENFILQNNIKSTVCEALSRTFGLENFSPMRIVPTERREIRQAALDEFTAHVQAQGLPNTFRIETRRSEKAWPETSSEINAWLGGVILDAYPSLKVDLTHPQFTVGLELRYEKSFLWTEKFRGPGGLPVGTNGHLLCLLSGGLDSPVAALRLLQRGASVSFIHFHGTPFVGEEVLAKVEDLARLVNRFQPNPKPLIVIPFGKLQEQIALHSPARMRTILYRRLMIRIACALAQEQKMEALITGESLGQVASQTIQNLSTINACSKLPILRPLIGMDKEEIIQSAKKWRTYDTSIRPGLDCCTLFSDKHPLTHAFPAQVEAIEAQLPTPLEHMIQNALQQREVREL